MLKTDSLFTLAEHTSSTSENWRDENVAFSDVDDEVIFSKAAETVYKLHRYTNINTIDIYNRLVPTIRGSVERCTGQK